MLADRTRKMLPVTNTAHDKARFLAWYYRCSLAELVDRMLERELVSDPTLYDLYRQGKTHSVLASVDPSATVTPPPTP